MIGALVTPLPSLIVALALQVYCCGQNGHGQYGTGDTASRTSPRLVPALSGLSCIAVACGYQHTVLLTSRGDVYTCGSDEVGVVVLDRV